MANVQWMHISAVIILLGWNLAAIAVMGLDKRKARLQRRRIAESTLWLFAFLGGAAGIWIGMKLFRHKTLKPAFKYGVPLLLFLQLGAAIWWVSR